MSGQWTPPKAHDLLNLAEPDYLHGTGAIRLRVTKVHESQPIEGWLQVTGKQIGWNGADLGQRSVLVRVGARIQARETR